MWHKTTETLKRIKQTNKLKKESIDAYQFYDSDEPLQNYVEKPRRTQRKKTKDIKKDKRDSTNSKPAKTGLKSTQIKISPKKTRDNLKLSKYSNRLQHLLKVAQSKRREIRSERNRILKQTKHQVQQKSPKKNSVRFVQIISSAGVTTTELPISIFCKNNL